MTSATWLPRHRRVTGAILAAYLVALVFVLGWPTPVDAGVNDTLLRALGWLHGHGLPAWVGYDQVEFAANVVLFVPVGLLLALELYRRPWWVAALGGFGLSVLAELAQALTRPDRFATGRDVLANTLGAVVGAAVIGARSRSRSRARPRRPAADAPARDYGPR
ncbi:VanZ family protein [Pengzhenrongella sicca]|uniref:VanZ family protein n=1 Tax=Pengzhenrongella sicca TaxID=2819238 RepID=A0A8A4ZH89_9MICO|nr:VanZ family protein [Pengzhenrongella sicca]QTE29008.1 VanZ family protein [Pengzhenrongella sicca]